MNVIWPLSIFLPSYLFYVLVEYNCFEVFLSHSFAQKHWRSDSVGKDNLDATNYLKYRLLPIKFDCFYGLVFRHGAEIFDFRVSEINWVV